jgi:hypothetical protein
VATYLCDQSFIETMGATTVGGIGGAPQQTRGAERKGKLHWKHWTLSNSGAATPSASLGGASLAIGDVIVLGNQNWQDRMVFGRNFFSAAGAGTLMSVGKLDLNNAANTDAVHYKAATTVAAAGNYDLDTNMGEQMGTDATGAVTDVGNALPFFGSGSIQVTATITGAVPAVGTTLNGYFIYAVGD